MRREVDPQISKGYAIQLTHLQQGVAYFNFSQASSYKSDVSRQTLLNEIVARMRQDPDLPVLLEP